MKWEDHNDAELIARVAACDRDAFELLYYRYAGRILKFLNRLLGPSELHEDVVNDVMIVIWQRAAQFRPPSKLSTWIFGIARRKSLEAYHHAAKGLTKTASIEANRWEEYSLEDIALEEERHDRIRLAMNRLPPEQRHALILAFYHNCSQNELLSE